MGVVFGIAKRISVLHQGTLIADGTPQEVRDSEEVQKVYLGGAGIMLEVKEIHSYYGTSHILFGISLEVKEGEAVCLLGRNGAGKTTTFRSIIGLTPPKTGSIRFRDQKSWGSPLTALPRWGLDLFPTLGGSFRI